MASILEWIAVTAAKSLNIAEGSRLWDATTFFIADVLKIFLLLIVIIFIISLLRTALPPEKIRKILSKKKGILGNIAAAALGIITPFCTCSAIPLFMGFIEGGVPLGITFSFLIASPMINEIALILLLGMFGWKIALIYVISGMLIAILAGIIIGKMGMEKQVARFLRKRLSSTRKMSFRQRMEYAKDYTLDVLINVWLWVIIGVGVGAWIHGYVPADFLARYAGAGAWYAVPVAVLIGVPLYSNAAGIIPLVAVLTEKGVRMGTVLAFMMAVTGLSLPEFMILRKVMKPKLLFTFIAIVTIGILITGYLFNAII